MSELEEIQLRRLKTAWRSRQDSAGAMTLFLGFLTLGTCLCFVSAPSRQLACLMACLVVLVVLSCGRLILSAARVVEIGKRLNPPRHSHRHEPDIIEAEVVEAVERRAWLV